jgi:hypothetical protein
MVLLVSPSILIKGALIAAMVTHLIHGLHPLNKGILFGPEGLVSENKSDRDRPRQAGVLQMLVAPDLKPGISKEEIWELKLRLTLATLAVILDDGSMVLNVEDGLEVFVTTLENVMRSSNQSQLKMHEFLFPTEKVPMLTEQAMQLVSSTLAPAINFLVLNSSVPTQWGKEEHTKLREMANESKGLKDYVKETVLNSCENLALNVIVDLVSDIKEDLLNKTKVTSANEMGSRLKHTYHLSIVIMILLIVGILLCLLAVHQTMPMRIF